MKLSNQRLAQMAAGMVRPGKNESEHQIIRYNKIIEFSAATAQPRVVQQLGVVRGIVVRSHSIFDTIGGALQTLVGGKITLFTELCEKTRKEAFDIMVDHG